MFEESMATKAMGMAHAQPVVLHAAAIAMAYDVPFSNLSEVTAADSAVVGVGCGTGGIRPVPLLPRSLLGFRK